MHKAQHLLFTFVQSAQQVKCAGLLGPSSVPWLLGCGLILRLAFLHNGAALGGEGLSL